MERNESAERVDLRRSVRIALANGWIVLLLVVLGAGGAYAWSKSKPKVYSATAVVRVFDPNDATPAASANARVDPAREVQIEVLYARSSLVSDEVDKRLGNDAHLVKKQSVTGSADSDTIAITVQSASRVVAQNGARMYASVFVEQRQAAIAQQYSVQIAQLRTSINGVNSDLTKLDKAIAAAQTPGSALLPNEPEQLKNYDAQRGALVSRSAALSSQVSTLALASSSQQSDLSVVQTASLPKTPITPLPHRDAVLGGVIGLLLGLGLVGLRLRLRDKIVTSADLAAAFPSLSFIVATPPRLSMLERRRRRRRAAPLDVVDGRDAVREAYGVLRASVLYDDPKPYGCSLLVTSAHEGEGKTVIAANLALSLARGGARVVVVDCDLHDPSLHRRFGVDDGFGLSSVLVSSASAKSAVRRVGVGGATIDVVPAGPTVADPADLLVRPKLADVLAELKGTYDYVVLDGPPVLPAADGLALARIADGVLLVVRSGKTRENALVQVESRLRGVGARVAGAALVGVRSDRLPPPGALAVPSARWRAVGSGDASNADVTRNPNNGNGNGNGKGKGADAPDSGDVLIL